MVDSEYSSDNYKSLRISTGAITKNPEMLRFVPDYLKTKNKYENRVKRLSLVVGYVSDLYETREMCNKAVVENGVVSVCS